MIRQGEARTACNYIGVKPENVHFLNLPFYETGTIKKGDLTEVDRDIVKDLLEKIKPDQIFVAGDLADPHGTHRVCLDAVLAAIDDIKDEEWMKNCRIWMYRGAWAEWEIENRSLVMTNVFSGNGRKTGIRQRQTYIPVLVWLRTKR